MHNLMDDDAYAHTHTRNGTHPHQMLTQTRMCSTIHMHSRTHTHSHSVTRTHSHIHAQTHSPACLRPRPLCWLPSVQHSEKSLLGSLQAYSQVCRCRGDPPQWPGAGAGEGQRKEDKGTNTSSSSSEFPQWCDIQQLGGTVPYEW